MGRPGHRSPPPNILPIISSDWSHCRFCLSGTSPSDGEVGVVSQADHHHEYHLRHDLDPPAPSSSPVHSSLRCLRCLPPFCLQLGLWSIFQSVLTTACDWHLTNTPNSHLNAQMNGSKSPLVSISEQQWPLLSSVLAHHHHHLHPDGHCCLHPGLPSL